MTDHRYRDINAALPKLAGELLHDGDELESRAGSTRELLHEHIALEKPWRREILLPGRRASLPAQIAETMWVLSGRNDVDWLSHYLPRAAEFSDDGKVWRGAYGPRIREWNGEHEDRVSVDQLAHVVELLRNDPNTRRAVISIYDPAVDTQDGKDIPCNDLLVFSLRLGQLDLSVHTRSNDLIWGWSGINQFEWSALQEIVAGLVGAEIGELHFNVVSLHLYSRHYARARELASNHPMPTAAGSPRFEAPASVHALDALIGQWFELEEKLRTGDLGGEVTRRVHEFPEPMLRSWLLVIAWWWTNREGFLRPINGTDLAAALALSPGRKQAPRAELQADPFLDFVVQLHAEKHAVYGDSWKKRGEQISILANIARKIDRLGVAGAGDTAADTVIDLLVYLAKYRLWLIKEQGAPTPEAIRDWVPTGHTEAVEKLLRQTYASKHAVGDEGALTSFLIARFGNLQARVDAGLTRHPLVDDMLPVAMRLARELWEKEQPSSEGARIDAWVAGNAKRPWAGYGEDPQSVHSD